MSSDVVGMLEVAVEGGTKGGECAKVGGLTSQLIGVSRGQGRCLLVAGDVYCIIRSEVYTRATDVDV
jgi:hypothetical protein